MWQHQIQDWSKPVTECTFKINRKKTKKIQSARIKTLKTKWFRFSFIVLGYTILCFPLHIVHIYLISTFIAVKTWIYTNSINLNALKNASIVDTNLAQNFIGFPLLSEL